MDDEADLSSDEPASIRGEGFFVKAAWVIALLFGILGALTLAVVVLSAFQAPSLRGVPVGAASLALLLISGGYLDRRQSCRLFMAGACVVIVPACAWMIRDGFALEGLASNRWLLIAPLVVGLFGALAFVHPDVRAWMGRPRR